MDKERKPCKWWGYSDGGIGKLHVIGDVLYCQVWRDSLFKFYCATIRNSCQEHFSKRGFTTIQEAQFWVEDKVKELLDEGLWMLNNQQE